MELQFNDIHEKIAEYCKKTPCKDCKMETGRGECLYHTKVHDWLLEMLRRG